MINPCSRTMEVILFCSILIGPNHSLGQFLTIQTGTSCAIELCSNGDTLIISGTDMNGLNYFAKTSDLGETLITLEPPGLPGYSNFSLNVSQNCYYLISSFGFPIFDSQIIKSVDGGSSWNSVGELQGLYYSLAMVDTTFGIVGGSAGSGYHFAMTQGSDLFWEVYPFMNYVTAVQGYGDSTMLLMSSIYGGAYRTNDKGNSFEFGYGHSSRHEAIHFHNRDTIFTVSNSASGNPKAFFSRSYDGGLNFQTISIGLNQLTNQYDFYAQVHDLYFTSACHGYLIGYHENANKAAIFETFDGGNTWDFCLLEFDQVLNSLCFVNDSTAFIGGKEGLLLKWNTGIPLSHLNTSFEKLWASDIFVVYPNPTSNRVTFTVTDQELANSSYTVCSMTGATLCSGHLKGGTITLDVGLFSSGCYVVHIRNKDALFTEKLIVLH